MQRLGEYLVEKGWLRQEALDHALALQERSGERLGVILLALSMVRQEQLYIALSDLWGFPYVRLAQMPAYPPGRNLPLEEAVRLQAAVYGEEDGKLLVAVAERPDSEMQTVLARHYPGRRFRFTVTTHWDLDHYLRNAYRQVLLDRAVYALYELRKDVSAYTVLTRGQYLVFSLLVMGMLGGLYLAPLHTIVTFNALVTTAFLVVVVFKFWVAWVGAAAERDIRITDEEVASLDERGLPHYTVLVPVYREAHIVREVLDHVVSLDYPSEKLEILVLIEEDDEETWEAAKAAKPPDFVHLVRIPDGLPKTKPKACNVGLAFARGEYLVIYDVEDRPERDQLKKAVLAFRKGSPSLVCVQAALNYFNWNENWLTRLFCLEYSYWFDYVLPGLDRLNLPIPLGGTSNHFRTDRLKALGGWDPFNVTEDADLGIRAAQFGYRVGIVNSTTYEEANSRTGNWLRQRSRWIKGYMQTMLVHSRNPLRLVRETGLGQALAFVLLIGGTPVTFLAYLPALGLYAWWLATGSHALDPYFPSVVLYMGLFNCSSAMPWRSTSPCSPSSSAGSTASYSIRSPIRSTGYCTAWLPTRLSGNC